MGLKTPILYHLISLFQVVSLTSHDRTQFSFSSLPGQGVIFSVIVRDPVLNTSASYIPVHTYACSFNSTLDGCSDLGEKMKENLN